MPLAVSVQGAFESYFKGKPSPLVQPDAAQQGQQPAQPTPRAAAGGTVETSPDTARLVVIGSSEFLTDVVFQLSSNLSPDRYLNSLQFLQNAVDWSVEDLDLLTIRSRGAQSRVLAPMDDGQRSFWEFLNYGLALAALLFIGIAWNVRARNEKPLALEPVERDVRPARQA